LGCVTVHSFLGEGYEEMHFQGSPVERVLTPDASRVGRGLKKRGGEVDWEGAGGSEGVQPSSSRCQTNVIRIVFEEVGGGGGSWRTSNGKG